MADRRQNLQVKDKMNSAPQITPSQVKELLDQQADFVLLDVREQVEFDIARIAEGRLLPMSEIQMRIGELQPDRDQRIVVYCHHGGRSQQVADWLMMQGFAQVENMFGGIDRWSQEVDPAVPRY